MVFSMPSRKRSTFFYRLCILIALTLTACEPAAVNSAPVILLPTPTRRMVHTSTPVVIPSAIAVPVAETATIEPSMIPPTPNTPAACIPQNTEIHLGRVTRVIDGSQIEAAVDGETWVVTFAGIESPAPLIEKTAILGQDQQIVLIKEKDRGTDQPNQHVRYVMADDHFINLEMIQSGDAKVDAASAPSCAQIFLDAESEARVAKKGVWGPTPIPTLTFWPTVGLGEGNSGACDCSVRWTCDNFRSQKAAQSCFDACNDYTSLLDDNHDGKACENLP